MPQNQNYTKSKLYKNAAKNQINKIKINKIETNKIETNKIINFYLGSNVNFRFQLLRTND